MLKSQHGISSGMKQCVSPAADIAISCHLFADKISENIKWMTKTLMLQKLLMQLKALSKDFLQ